MVEEKLDGRAETSEGVVESRMSVGQDDVGGGSSCLETSGSILGDHAAKQCDTSSSCIVGFAYGFGEL